MGRYRPMQIIISDTSCLIDLRKGGLLSGLLALPYRFAIPLPLFEDELLDMSTREKAMLVESGLEHPCLSATVFSSSGGFFPQVSTEFFPS